MERFTHEQFDPQPEHSATKYFELSPRSDTHLDLVSGLATLEAMLGEYHVEPSQTHLYIDQIPLTEGAHSHPSLSSKVWSRYNQLAAELHDVQGQSPEASITLRSPQIYDHTKITLNELGGWDITPHDQATPIDIAPHRKLLSLLLAKLPDSTQISKLGQQSTQLTDHEFTRRLIHTLAPYAKSRTEMHTFEGVDIVADDASLRELHAQATFTGGNNAADYSISLTTTGIPIYPMDAHTPPNQQHTASTTYTYTFGVPYRTGVPEYAEGSFTITAATDVPQEYLDGIKEHEAVTERAGDHLLRAIAILKSSHLDFSSLR